MEKDTQPLIPLSIDPHQSLQYSCERQIVALFKEFLSMVEGLAEEHDETLAKLAGALPKEYHPHLDLADYFTLDRADRLRRAILQRGNDCKRAIRQEIDKYNVEFRS